MKWLKKIFQKRKRAGLPSQLFILECLIHGSHYYDCFSLIEKRGIFIGEPLVLIREPKNEFDNYAIEVFTQNREKLGYIPKKHNLVISNLMDQKVSINAFVETIIINAWDPISIKLTINKIY